MITLKDIPGIVRRAVRTGTNLHLTGEPGLGKTSVIEQTVAVLQQEDPAFGWWCLYTPALSPVDFSVPMPDQASGTLRMYHNDRLPNGYTVPDARGIVFLGERDNADPATNKALQKYINNEDMGGLRKPAGVIVISDSNDIHHRSGAVQQSLALLSRSRVLPVSIDVDCTLHYFAEIGLNPYVQAYLRLRKEHVSTFGQVLKERAYRVWANPRAWERLGNSLDDANAQGETLSDDEIIGDVGEAVGREFVAFMYAATQLVSYGEIVQAPTTTHKPDKLSDTYAIIAMLAISTPPADMAAVRTYVERFGVEVQVLFLRLMVSNKGKHRDENCRTKAYTDWFSKPELRAALGV
jgi:hypothetical protein